MDLSSNQNKNAQVKKTEKVSNEVADYEDDNDYDDDSYVDDEVEEANKEFDDKNDEYDEDNNNEDEEDYFGNLKGYFKEEIGKQLAYTDMISAKIAGKEANKNDAVNSDSTFDGVNKLGTRKLLRKKSDFGKEYDYLFTDNVYKQDDFDAIFKDDDFQNEDEKILFRKARYWMKMARKNKKLIFPGYDKKSKIPINREALKKHIYASVDRTLQHGPLASSFNKANINEAIIRWRIHKDDVGSADVQAAIAHEKVKYLTMHMLKNKHDMSTKRALQAYVVMRRKQLDYIHRHNVTRASEMVQAFGIRFHPSNRPWQRAVKYSAYRNTKSRFEISSLGVKKIVKQKKGKRRINYDYTHKYSDQL